MYVTHSATQFCGGQSEGEVGGASHAGASRSPEESAMQTCLVHAGVGEALRLANCFSWYSSKKQCEGVLTSLNVRLLTLT